MNMVEFAGRRGVTSTSPTLTNITAGTATMADKHCRVCDSLKSTNDFYRSARQADGFQTQCKGCQNSRRQKWSADNRGRERVRQRAEYASDPQRHLARKAEWRTKNKDKVREIGIRSRRKAISSGVDRSSEWAKKNPERRREIARRWYANNSVSAAAKARAYRNASISRVLNGRVSARLREQLRENKDWRSTSELLGYSMRELSAHLERQFLPGMSWGNMGEWHIDHVIPLSSFDISGPEDPELRAAWALPNLRPLWASENIRKKDKRTHLL